MTDILLNIAGRIEPWLLSTLERVCRVIEGLGLPYVLVGATARDLVMHHAYGASAQRATRDVDFAVEVEDWAAFEAIRASLLRQGFRATGVSHRLQHHPGVLVDIIPFGRIGDERAVIAWPPRGDIEMSVLGFREACDAALRVRVREAPVLDVRVVSPEGLALLKLMAWMQRPQEQRRKDATDLAYVLCHYEAIPENREVLYDSACMDIMEAYEWDLSLAAAWLLGRRVRAMSPPKARLGIGALISGESKPLSLERLAMEMGGQHRDAQRLRAFVDGLG